MESTGNRWSLRLEEEVALDNVVVAEIYVYTQGGAGHLVSRRLAGVTGAPPTLENTLL